MWPQATNLNTREDYIVFFAILIIGGAFGGLLFELLQRRGKRTGALEEVRRISGYLDLGWIQRYASGDQRQRSPVHTVDASPGRLFEGPLTIDTKLWRTQTHRIRPSAESEANSSTA